MGNCQAIDAATLVIQHPSGKTERFYSPMSARQVMKMNPAHCVAGVFFEELFCSLMCIRNFIRIIYVFIHNSTHYGYICCL